MVLQQELKIPVWGWASAGEKITVTLGSQTATATASADGNWRVDLPPIPSATAQPMVLTVTGTNALTFHDVLVGDVWLASGQSNMDFGIANVEKSAGVIAQANEPQLRLFSVTKTTSLTPQKDIGESPYPFDATWFVCTPENLSKVNGKYGFSAVAFFFGREIQHTTGHPVGLILSDWGGTPAQAWTSLSGLQKDPALAPYVEARGKIAAIFDQIKGDYPKAQAEYEAAKKQWDSEVGTALMQETNAWSKQVSEAVAKGETPPPRPVASRPRPSPPPSPDGGNSTPANLYNAMIAPLIPYGIKGVIWYQGEANANREQDAVTYRTLFPRLITDWREQWGQGDFPFLHVQLANFLADLIKFKSPPVTPAEGVWPFLREAQLQALTLPNTGMAVAIDIGNPVSIHPADKQDVGLRLALAAKHVAYGQDIVFSGPIYDSMKIEGQKIVLRFKNIGGGLQVGNPPWSPAGMTIPRPTDLSGFGIAGENKKWVWAKAAIEGDTVVVSSHEVPSPVAVRYGWANAPFVNLYNKEGLPTSPFRTDTW